MAEFVVKYLIPPTVAPNLITTVAFMFIIFSYLLILSIDSENYDHYIPGWYMGIYGACTLIYQLLDNCDGKQARKTKTGSPLGYLFDHGCDAITTFLIT